MSTYRTNLCPTQDMINTGGVYLFLCIPLTTVTHLLPRSACIDRQGPSRVKPYRELSPAID